MRKLVIDNSLKMLSEHFKVVCDNFNTDIVTFWLGRKYVSWDFLHSENVNNNNNNNNLFIITIIFVYTYIDINIFYSTNYTYIDIFLLIKETGKLSVFEQSPGFF